MKTKGVIIFILVCVVFYLMLTPRHRQNHSPYIEKVRRFSKIGNAIEYYSWDHDGQLPLKLSELYPHYIKTNELSVFYPPDSTNQPPGWNLKPELADDFSDCIYLGASGISHEVIAYERENAKNTSGGKLLIIIPGAGESDATKPELNELLSTNDSWLLENYRKERVIYYECNLHGSLNLYRGDFGAYPNGDNASVLKILRGDNPAKKQYHSNFRRERDSNGQDLDPWGTPYLIKSDGNRVRMKSAGNNRVFDHIGSTNYDNICFTITNGAIMGDDSKF
jgi:hypothetical protein